MKRRNLKTAGDLQLRSRCRDECLQEGVLLFGFSGACWGCYLSLRDFWLSWIGFYRRHFSCIPILNHITTHHIPIISVTSSLQPQFEFEDHPCFCESKIHPHEDPAIWQHQEVSVHALVKWSHAICNQLVVVQMPCCFDIRLQPMVRCYLANLLRCCDLSDVM